MNVLLFVLLIFGQSAFGQETLDKKPIEENHKSAFLKMQDEAYLQRHYPFYFAYNAGLTKVQVSFKSPLVKNFPLYFGYTQLMFWALNDESKPFRDLIYNPELFYRYRLSLWGLLTSLDMGLWSHSSNGRSGEPFICSTTMDTPKRC